MDTEDFSKYYDFISKHKQEDIIKMAMRYETVRKLNAFEFGVIWKRCLRGECFDDVIDSTIK